MGVLSAREQRQIRYNVLRPEGGGNGITGEVTQDDLAKPSVGTEELFDDSVTNAKLANMPGNTAKVNDQATEGDPVDLLMTEDTVLGRLAGENLKPIPLVDLPGGLPPDDSITNAKLAEMINYTVKGNATGATDNPQDIGPAGVATVFGREASGNLAFFPISNLPGGLPPPDSVTNAMLAEMLATTIKANATGSTANPQDVAVATGHVLANISGSALVSTQVVNSLLADGSVDSFVLADFSVSTAKLQLGAVANDRLDNMPAFSVKVRDSISGGVPSDQVLTDDTVLGKRSGENFLDAIPFAELSGVPAPDSVTNAMLAPMPQYTVKGNATITNPDNPQDIAIGINRLVGRNTGDIAGIQVDSPHIVNGAVSQVKMEDIAANDVYGNDSGVTGPPALINLTASTVLGRGPTGEVRAVTWAEIGGGGGAGDRLVSVGVTGGQELVLTDDGNGVVPTLLLATNATPANARLDLFSDRGEFGLSGAAVDTTLIGMQGQLIFQSAASEFNFQGKLISLGGGQLVDIQSFAETADGVVSVEGTAGVSAGFTGGVLKVFATSGSSNTAASYAARIELTSSRATQLTDMNASIRSMFKADGTYGGLGIGHWVLTQDFPVGGRTIALLAQPDENRDGENPATVEPGNKCALKAHRGSIFSTESYVLITGENLANNEQGLPADLQIDKPTSWSEGSATGGEFYAGGQGEFGGSLLVQNQISAAGVNATAIQALGDLNAVAKFRTLGSQSLLLPPGIQNDFQIVTDTSWFKIRSDGLGVVGFSGFDGGTDGRHLWIVNENAIDVTGDSDVLILHDNSGSLPENRIITGNAGSNINLQPQDSMQLIYDDDQDSGTKNWRVVA